MKNVISKKLFTVFALGPVLWIAAVAIPRVARAEPPGFSVENHYAAEGTQGAEVNSAVLPLTVTGSNTLLVTAWHSEYDGDLPDNWVVKCSGVPGTLVSETNGYKTPRCFRIYYWVNLPQGVNNVLVSNSYTGPNEIAVSAVLFTNAAQTGPLGVTVLDVSTNSRTDESETVTTTTNDLVVHVIADALFTRGTLSIGEISRSVANDGNNTNDGDASLWISTKAGESLNTTVYSTGWAGGPVNGVINGAALVIHGRTSIPPTITSIAPDDQGGVAVTVSGTIDLVYALEASDDFSNWIQVGIQTNTTGSVVFSHQPTTNLAGYYRAVAVP